MTQHFPVQTVPFTLHVETSLHNRRPVRLWTVQGSGLGTLPSSAARGCQTEEVCSLPASATPYRFQSCSPLWLQAYLGTCHFGGCYVIHPGCLALLKSFCYSMTFTHFLPLWMRCHGTFWCNHREGLLRVEKGASSPPECSLAVKAELFSSATHLQLLATNPPPSKPPQQLSPTTTSGPISLHWNFTYLFLFKLISLI